MYAEISLAQAVIVAGVQEPEVVLYNAQGQNHSNDKINRTLYFLDIEVRLPTPNRGWLGR